MSGHRQVWVKVNAAVDLGVRDLVTALSAFPTVQTLESCQGGPDRPAWVSFVVGSHCDDSWRELALFVLGTVGPKLAYMVGDRATMSVVVTEAGRVQGELAVHPGGLRRTARALRQLRRTYRGRP